MGTQTLLFIVAGLLAAAAIGNSQRPGTPTPSNLQNLTAYSDTASNLVVEYDYTGKGNCKCNVISIQKGKKIFDIKICVRKFSLSVEEGTYEVNVRCRSERMSKQVQVSAVPMCADLDAIPNGSVDTSGSTPDSTATYTCDEGYEVRGEATRTCQNDGTWSGEEPKCKVSKENVCHYLDTFGRGILDNAITGNCELSDDCLNMTCAFSKLIVTTEVGIVFEVRLIPCASPPAVYLNTNVLTFGTLLDGTFHETTSVPLYIAASDARGSILLTIQQMQQAILLDIKLNISGQVVSFTPEDKDNKLAICCKQCDPLEDIENGGVNEGNREAGDTAMYYCDEGFEIIGEEERTCQEDTKWSGKEPTCKITSACTCSSMRNWAAKLLEQSENNQGNCSISSDCQTLSCIGLMNHFEYTLVAVLRPCDPVPSVWIRKWVNGILLISKLVTQNAVWQFNANSTVHTTIDYEQQPFGATISMSIEVNGENVMEMPPVNIKMMCVCPPLPNIQNGMVTEPPFSDEGSEAIYTCRPTYRMEGSPVRGCHPDGEWRGPEPMCESTTLTMCATANEIMTNINKEPHLSGECEVSDRCLEISCSVNLDLGGSTIVPFGLEITLLPCKTPYAIHVVMNNVPAGVVVDQEFSENAGIVLEISDTPVEISIGIDHSDHAITMMIEVSYPGLTYTLLPSTTVVMHCHCPILSFPCGSIDLTHGNEIGSVATYACNSAEVTTCNYLRTCTSHGTWSGETPVCTATKNLMCQSSSEASQNPIGTPVIPIGNCNTSDDCTKTNCIVMAQLPNGLVETESTIIYYPCTTPYSFRMAISIPEFSFTFDEIINESKTVAIGGLNSMVFNVGQGCSAITFSVTANLYGQVLNIITASTVHMHCEEC